MNRKILLIFFLLASITFAETWNSFSIIEPGHEYAFDTDSLKKVDVGSTNFEFVIKQNCQCHEVISIDNSFFYIDSFVFFDENVFFTHADSIWIWNTFDYECRTDIIEKLVKNGIASIEYFKNFTHDSSSSGFYNMTLPVEGIPIYVNEYTTENSFDDVEVSAFIYQKDSSYKALCWFFLNNAKMEEKDSACPSSAVYCLYQNDGTLDFHNSLKMENTEWKQEHKILQCTSSTESIFFEKNEKLFYRENEPGFRLNGSSATQKSSNIIIKNKQPTLQLKRRPLK